MTGRGTSGVQRGSNEEHIRNRIRFEQFDSINGSSCVICNKPEGICFISIYIDIYIIYIYTDMSISVFSKLKQNIGLIKKVMFNCIYKNENNFPNKKIRHSFVILLYKNINHNY